MRVPKTKNRPLLADGFPTPAFGFRYTIGAYLKATIPV